MSDQGDQGGVAISIERPFVCKRCRVDGRDMAYVRTGSGERPVLLVHGITTSSFIWDDVIPYLEGDCDVVAVDLLGCGESDRALPADYSLEAHAARLSGIVEHLGWRQLHLAQHIRMNGGE